MNVPRKALFAASKEIARLILERNGLDRTKWDVFGFEQSLTGHRFDFILVADIHPEHRLSPEKIDHLRTRLAFDGELIII